MGCSHVATPKNELVTTAEDAQALKSVDIKAGRFRFSSANIPIGATLNFVKDLNLIATVVEDSWVSFDGQKHSLTTAALEALKKCGYNWRFVSSYSINVSIKGLSLCMRFTLFLPISTMMESPT